METETVTLSKSGKTAEEIYANRLISLEKARATRAANVAKAKVEREEVIDREYEIILALAAKNSPGKAPPARPTFTQAEIEQDLEKKAAKKAAKVSVPRQPSPGIQLSEEVKARIKAEVKNKSPEANSEPQTPKPQAEPQTVKNTEMEALQAQLAALQAQLSVKA
jgi:hypothetical protein